jgi:hypothetical protein
MEVGKSVRLIPSSALKPSKLTVTFSTERSGVAIECLSDFLKN